MKKFLINFISIFIFFNFSLFMNPMSVRIATDDWAPYEFSNNNKIIGFSTEVVYHVLEHMGVSVEKNEILPFVRTLNYLETGKIDISYSVYRDEEREKIFLYPDEPLIDAPWVFFIRKKDIKDIKYNTFSDFKDKKIGVVTGFSYTPEFWSFLNSYKNFEQSTVSEQNFKKLASGRVDIVADELAVGMNIIKEYKYENQITHLEKPLKVKKLYVIFSKLTVKKSFVDWFSLELNKFKKTEEYQKIYMKYFPD